MSGKFGHSGILVVGLIFIFLGLLSLLHFHPESFFWKLLIGFMTEIGFALLIAWGVARLIEAGARRDYDNYTQEKAKIISQNVFGYLYSVRFPRSAFSVLEKYIFQSPVIKTIQKLDYELLRPDDASGWTKMNCEFDYILKNVSEREVDHAIRFHVSRVSGGGGPSFSDLGLKSLIVGTEVIPPEKFQEFDKAAPDEVGQQKYEIVRRISPESELRVRVTFVQPKRVEDNDLWQSNSVCEKLELTLRYDPEFYDMFIEPVHPSSAFGTNIAPNHGSKCRMVSIDEALLPKNGVFMWWNQKQGPSADSTTS